MNLKYFDRLFNFIFKRSESILLLVDTAEDEINQGNAIKALVRILMVVFLIVIIASAAIFSIVLLFSKYGLIMKTLSFIIAWSDYNTQVLALNTRFEHRVLNRFERRDLVF